MLVLQKQRNYVLLGWCWVWQGNVLELHHVLPKDWFENVLYWRDCHPTGIYIKICKGSVCRMVCRNSRCSRLVIEVLHKRAYPCFQYSYKILSTHPGRNLHQRRHLNPWINACKLVPWDFIQAYRIKLYQILSVENRSPSEKGEIRPWRK